MILVSNTTPLNYLILIGEVGLIAQLYGRLVVPESVIAELSHPRSPAVVRSWTQALPAWVEVREIRLPPDPALAEFDAGERDALALAEEVRADLLLLDENAARQEAKRRGLRITGTLGVLDTAAMRDLVNFPDAVTRLRQTTFYVTDEVVAPLLAKHSQKP